MKVFHTKYGNSMKINPKKPSYIWLAFSFMFFVLSILHFVIMIKTVTPLKYEIPNTGIMIGSWELYEPVRTFIDVFNQYISYMNTASSVQNFAAGIGHALAMITAIFSFFQSKKEAKAINKIYNKLYYHKRNTPIAQYRIINRLVKIQRSNIKKYKR